MGINKALWHNIVKLPLPTKNFLQKFQIGALRNTEFKQFFFVLICFLKVKLDELLLN